MNCEDFVNFEIRLNASINMHPNRLPKVYRWHIVYIYDSISIMRAYVHG